MLKVKHLRTADCVVGGFRMHKDGAGRRVAAPGAVRRRRRAAPRRRGEQLLRRGPAPSCSASSSPTATATLDGHPWRQWAEADAEAAASGQQRRPGAQSRWNAGKDLTWEPLRIELVAEVAYEHLQGDRFRHTARFQRWRPDRTPASCTYEQLDTPVPMELREIFGV